MRLMLIALLVVLIGCESDADALARLHAEQRTQCLLAQRFEQTGDTTHQDAPIRCKLAAQRLEEFIAKH